MDDIFTGTKRGPGETSPGIIAPFCARQRRSTGVPFPPEAGGAVGSSGNRNVMGLPIRSGMANPVSTDAARFTALMVPSGEVDMSISAIASRMFSMYSLEPASSPG